MKRFSRFMLLAALIAVFVPGVSAITTSFTFDITVACTSASITVSTDSIPNGIQERQIIGMPYLYITLHNQTTGELLGKKIKYMLYTNGVGTEVMSATFSFPLQTPGDILRFTFGEGYEGGELKSTGLETPLHSETRVYTGEGCFGGSTLCRDGRVNEGTCELAAVYPVWDGAGYALSFWFVDHITGEGSFGFYVPSADLTNLPPNPEEPVLIGESPDGKAQLWWLPSNEFQFNIGPDWEGKMHTLRFSSFPGEDPVHETYWP